MFRWINADKFLMHFFDSRMVYLSGNYGSGKTSLAVLLTYTALRQGLVKQCVSTAPVAWAIPPRYCQPYSFIALLDETGAFFDARSFADRGQNKFRKDVVSYLRKLKAYVIVSSYLSPDTSFRSFAVQRVFAFPFLEWFHYSYEEGQQLAEGSFGVWKRSWLWATDKRNPSPKYVDEFVPTSFSPVMDLFRRAFDRLKQDDEYDPHELAKNQEGFLSEFQRWYRVGAPFAPYPGSGALGGDQGDLSRPGAAPHVAVGDQALYVGNVGETSTSGRISYRH